MREREVVLNTFQSAPLRTFSKGILCNLRVFAISESSDT